MLNLKRGKTNSDFTTIFLNGKNIQTNMVDFKCDVCGTKYEDEDAAIVCEFTHTDARLRKRCEFIIANLKTDNEELKEALKKELHLIIAYTRMLKTGKSDYLIEIANNYTREELESYEKESGRIEEKTGNDYLTDIEAHLQREELKSYARESGRIEERKNEGGLVNRVKLNDLIESEVHSQRGELESYARESGKNKILRDMLKQNIRIDCAYGSGKVIAIGWDIETNPPTKTNRCLIATQIGETKTHFGRIKRLSEAGCNEPNYSILSGSWKCKYADGKNHK